jgi:hypothetical protein
MGASLTNCYNIGNIQSTGISQSSNVKLCGIAGSMTSGTSINNCYYGAGKLSVNGIVVTDALFSGTAYIDGGGASFSTPARADYQNSGAKTLTQLLPSSANAQNGSSVYYTGVVTIGSARYAGWDFTNVWLIEPSISSGFPVLRSSFSTPGSGTVSVTGNIKAGTDNLTGVKVSYTTGMSGGEALTDASGNYSISVPSGSVFTITKIEKSGYKQTGVSPTGHYLTANATYNLTMTVGTPDSGGSGDNKGGNSDGDDDSDMMILIIIAVVVLIVIAAAVYFLVLRKK